MLARHLCKMLFAFLIPASAVAGQQAPAPRVVDLTAPDGLKLKGTFSGTALSGPGVLLLHQCNRQRKVWDDLATRMTAARMNVMTEDLRGYLDSEGTPIDRLTPGEVNVVFNETCRGTWKPLTNSWSRNQPFRQVFSSWVVPAVASTNPCAWR